MHRRLQLLKGIRSRMFVEPAHAQRNPAGILHAGADAGAQRNQEIGVVLVHVGTKVAPPREVQMQLLLHS